MYSSHGLRRSYAIDQTEQKANTSAPSPLSSRGIRAVRAEAETCIPPSQHLHHDEGGRGWGAHLSLYISTVSTALLWAAASRQRSAGRRARYSAGMGCPGFATRHVNADRLPPGVLPSPEAAGKPAKRRRGRLSEAGRGGWSFAVRLHLGQGVVRTEGRRRSIPVEKLPDHRQNREFPKT